MSKSQMPMSLFNALSLLMLASFTNLVLQRGWESTVSFLAIVTFVAFVLWLNPLQKQSITKEEFEKLEEETKSLKDQLTQLRIKIGFQMRAS